MFGAYANIFRWSKDKVNGTTFLVTVMANWPYIPYPTTFFPQVKKVGLTCLLCLSIFANDSSRKPIEGGLLGP